MDLKDPVTRLAIAAVYVSEFGISKSDLVRQNPDKWRSGIDGYSDSDYVIKRADKLAVFMVEGLARLYIEDSSKSHLRVFAGMQLKDDLGM
jgi:hypothetical protein